jgi:hypothetical protein
MANTQSLCQLVYRYYRWIATSVLKTTNVLLAEAGNIAELFLRQAFFQPDPLYILTHQSAHIHAQKEKDYTI